MLGAAIIHPNRREVIPLMPEPIVKQDGSKKNDCERNAAKRFIEKMEIVGKCPVTLIGTGPRHREIIDRRGAHGLV